MAQWSFITGSSAQSAVRLFIHDYEKKINYAWLNGRGGIAVKRAIEMDRRAKANGDERGNPTTGMGRLVAGICKQAEFHCDDL